MPTSDKSYVGFLISDASRLMRTIFDRRVRELGLTRSQWLVLRRLHRSPGASQSELADMMEIEKASAGRLIDRMEKNGWVERRPDDADRRVNRLFLTDQAVRVNARIQPVAEEVVDDALAGLSEAERAQLTGFMMLMKERLQAMAEAGETNGAREPRSREAREDDARALDLA